MKVLFSNVGRRKATFSADIPAITHRTLLRCVRPHLMSQNIDVIAGFRAVGSFRVEGGISLGTIILEERPDEAELQTSGGVADKKEENQS